MARSYSGKAGFAKHPECVKVDLQYEVHFGSTAGPAKDRQVIKTLTEIQDRVSGIIDSFAPLFPVRTKVDQGRLRAPLPEMRSKALKVIRGQHHGATVDSSQLA